MKKLMGCFLLMVMVLCCGVSPIMAKEVVMEGTKPTGYGSSFVGALSGVNQGEINHCRFFGTLENCKDNGKIILV